MTTVYANTTTKFNVILEEHKIVLDTAHSVL